MKQTNKLQKSYSQDWVVESEKRQERKEHKEHRRMRQSKRYQWMESA